MAHRTHPTGKPRRPRWGHALWLVLLGLTQACTSAAAESASRVARPAAGREPEGRGDHGQPASRPTAAADGVVFYDLAAHLDHAELRFGPTLLMNFGEPGDAKYTLGAWGTRIRRGAPVDGASTAFVRGDYGDVIVPVSAAAGPVAIDARLRAPRDGEITAYLDDQVVARLRSDASALSTLHFALSPEQAGPGEHMLRLRASGMGRIGPHSTALAIDWVSVGPEKAPAAPRVPAHAELAPEPDRLRIPDAFSLGFAFVVPEGAHFVADVTGNEAARLKLRATTDDLASVSLGDHAPGKLDVDLGALRGKLIRLDLGAASELLVSRPRIVVPRSQPKRQRAQPVRNALIYLVDTLRADHLKPFNPGTRVRTPGLDELVQKGSAIFTAAHTQENWTKPSVATLLSSLMPWEHHAVTTEAVVPAGIALLPERLREHGFHTGAFIANGYVSDKFGFKQGFDRFRNYIREGRYSRAEFLAADVVQWLDQRPQKLPFFLYVHAIDPHVPYKPTAQFLSIYDPLPYDGVVDFSGDTTLLEKIKVGSIKLKGRDKQRLEALYDSEISYHDVHFRSIMTALEKRGLLEDTMIVLVADHGEEFWDHGSVGHGHSVYEELLHIPMLVRLPGVTTAPVSVASAAGLVDVMPTVLDALGEPIPPELSGRSLLPELYGEAASAPPVTVSGFMDGWRTALIDGHKLIQRTEKRLSLHDLATDPSEQHDVAAARPLTTRYLRGQLGLALAATEAAEPSSPSGKRRHRGESTEIDAETEAQLRALGYVGSSRR